MNNQSVPRWSPNQSRSPSPTRWAPRRSSSSEHQKWEPSLSKKIPLFPPATIDLGEFTGQTRGTNTDFPFGTAPSFMPQPDDDYKIDAEIDQHAPVGTEMLKLHNHKERTVFDAEMGRLLRPQENAKHDRFGSTVSLTWENMWVTAGHTPILQGVSGFARPGEVLAIMGPSGCGKSTLLDTLAGRLGSNISRSGEILLNGQIQKLTFGTSTYVTQDDVLMTTMTVREAVVYSAQLQLPAFMTSKQKIERAEEMIKEMGLGSAADTRIGGWAYKGLSGGQRRRVSICLEILTRPPLLFLDEPTSGLDSAASYHVMSRIAGLARREGMTVVAAIHQPCSEVFELFHGLCLLAYGRTVWFGHPSITCEFFALNGFPCPSLRNPSDHYLRTINQDFNKDIEEGPEAEPTTTGQLTEILINSYNSSVASQQVSWQIAEIHKTGGSLVTKASQASLFIQSFVLIRRSFVNMYRDLGYYWLRFAIYISLCLCVGNVFHNVGDNFRSIQARGSMLSFVSSFVTFMSIGGFPSFVEDMKIFGRERQNGHYGVTAFVIGNTISSIPYLVLTSVIPGAIAYYLVGLQREIEHLAYFVLVLFMCLMIVEGLMMIVASIVPDFLMGIITGAGIQGVMMLSGGIFRLSNDLPKIVWRYPMYYISFHKYANQGFFKNEFIGLTFLYNQAGESITINGDEILRNIWEVDPSYSKWIDLAILFGMVIFYRILFLAILKATETFKPMLKTQRFKATTKNNRIIGHSFDVLH